MNWLRSLIVALLLVGVAVGVWAYLRPGSTALPSDAFPLPGYTASPYLNTGPDARYVGSQACAECHKSNHKSYMLTAHSKALSDLDPTVEPADGAFHHQASGHDYRIYRKGKEFRHEEGLKAADGKEVARMDFPIRYLIGSGHFCRSYLIEVDGFLQESPITWYTTKQKWDMSPGYDFPRHWSFERGINLLCLACHSGRVEQAPDSAKLSILEKAIGCESCHGPGSKHAEFRRANEKATPEQDFTIVHPGKLSRERLESICAVCHLNDAAQVPLRGRDFNQFRPGMPLADYRTDYSFNTGNEQMKVVGHISQLRQSKCYQKSNDLTCVTCHEPHAKEKPKDLTAYYRQKCLDCHASQGCKLEPAQRKLKQPNDDCSACHMPRGDTDIPHIAFTHHRIGRHMPQRTSQFALIPHLVPTDSVAHLSKADQDRNLGLAYVAVAGNPQHARDAEVFRKRGRELLEPLHAAGMRDPVTAYALAGVSYANGDHVRAAAYADEALAAKDLPVDYRIESLVIRAACQLQSGSTSAGIQLLEEIAPMRRKAEDWRLLGRLYLEREQPRLALPAYEKALAIRPYRPDIHAGLAEVYRRLGDPTRAKEHDEKAQWLTKEKRE